MTRILRELVAVQARQGWLSDGVLEGPAERLGLPLHRLERLASFYPHLRREPAPDTEIAACRDLACWLAAADEPTLCALHETLAQTSLCGLGQVARGPLPSIPDRFPDRLPRIDGRVEARVLEEDADPEAGGG